MTTWKATLSNTFSRAFITALDVASDILADLVIEVSENGVHLNMMDPEHVSLLDLNFPKISPMWRTYELEGDTFYLCTSAEALNERLSIAEKDDRIILFYDKEKPSILEINIEGTNANTRFQLPLRVLGEFNEFKEIQPELKNTLTSVAVTSPTVLDDVIKVCGMISSDIQISITPDSITFIGRDSENIAHKRYTPGTHVLKIESEEEVTATYGRDYLQRLSKLTSKQRDLNLTWRYKASGPLLLETQVGAEGCIALFLIAPYEQKE